MLIHRKIAVKIDPKVSNFVTEWYGRPRQSQKAFVEQIPDLL